MVSLRVNKVNYRGKLYHFESPFFFGNLVVIEGDNGTGKSTLCNLIYYGLGGKVKEFNPAENEWKHKEITSDSENYVELFISIATENYHLLRFINNNDIVVTPYSMSQQDGDSIPQIELITDQMSVMPVNRLKDGSSTFSDWLLVKLGISVVEIYMGYNSFKINLNHLFRLMYHDQQPDPEGIYKKLDDKENYVSDSELLRKAIFELLIGKSFSAYYDSIAETKKLERQKAVAKDSLDEYKSIVDAFHVEGEKKNLSFLQADLEAKGIQLQELYRLRESHKIKRVDRADISSQIESVKNSIVDIELNVGDLDSRRLALYNEKSELLLVKEATKREIAQIQKIIHSHDQLNLFSVDTCPYCLTKVERAEGHCVCGSSLTEEQYERFFYTSQEYKDMLKSKTKTLSTISLAIDGCTNELGEVEKEIQQNKGELINLKSHLSVTIKHIDDRFNLEAINQIDDKIFDVKNQISELNRVIEVESQLAGLQKKFDETRKLHEASLNRTRHLEAQTRIDIQQKVEAFSEKYGSLMTQTLAGCRTARINPENYMPILDEGEYKEASSNVSRRLMYYLTLMEMSLEDDSVPFPKFLLIDTPETSGIELSNLISCLQKIEDLKRYDSDFQVILTTGLGKYPETLTENVVVFMPNKSGALLKRNESFDLAV